jgi:hypothetical protein
VANHRNARDDDQYTNDQSSDVAREHGLTLVPHGHRSPGAMP